MNTLSDFIDRKRAKDREWHAQIKRRHLEAAAMLDSVARDVAPYTTACPMARYAEWLRRYIESGGEPTHWYDYPFQRAEMLLATGDFRLPALYGSMAVSVVVPAGISVTTLGGHNKLYLEESWLAVGRFVPVYVDVARHLGAEI